MKLNYLNIFLQGHHLIETKIISKKVPLNLYLSYFKQLENFLNQVL